MKKKTPNRPTGSILHLSELVPITDPTEQAELDRRFRAAEKTLAAIERPRKPKRRCVKP